jgi:tetratricopeptide (TPR) repeat protein
LLSLKSIYPIGVKGAYPTAAIPARFYLETRKWDAASKLSMSSNDYPADKFPWSNGIIHFARILGAVHTNDITSAKIDFEKLSACHQNLLNKNDVYMANQVNIMVNAANAWIHFYENKKEEAIALMIESANLEYKTEKQSLTPGEVLPAQELLGDLLLKSGKHAKALEAYELNLIIRPNRFNGLYGAAVAAKQSGNYDKAKIYFEKLLELTENANGDRSEVKEAEAFVYGKAI